jgi:hypothetical protein
VIHRRCRRRRFGHGSAGFTWDAGMMEGLFSLGSKFIQRRWNFDFDSRS